MLLQFAGSLALWHGSRVRVSVVVLHVKDWWSGWLWNAVCDSIESGITRSLHFKRNVFLLQAILGSIGLVTKALLNFTSSKIVFTFLFFFHKREFNYKAQFYYHVSLMSVILKDDICLHLGCLFENVLKCINENEICWNKCSLLLTK